MRGGTQSNRLWLALLLCCLGMVVAGAGQSLLAAEKTPDGTPEQALVRQYCLDCHNPDEQAGGLNLEALSQAEVASHTATWETVVRKLRARQMPPAEVSRPSERQYAQALSSLEAALDQAAAGHPFPGRTSTLRRLTRTEHQNVIRDLLALEIDVGELLPADDSSHGFDNLSAGDLSPTLLDRYISAAQQISALAVGNERLRSDTIRIPADITQEKHVSGLPIGTRGGVLLPYHFPQGGEYEVQVRLARDRNEEVEGLTEPHELDLLLDRQSVATFTIEPPRGAKTHQTADAHLKTRLKVSAGPHQLGVTFLKNPSSLLETKRQPYQAHFNMHRHPRLSPAVYQVSITGPYEPTGPGDTPSRRRIFIALPSSRDDEKACAAQILTALMRRAYRRPVTDEDLERPLELFREARAERDFYAGIELALSAVLISPQFLFRIEREPPGVAAGTVYRISDLELASRLSFFLWSSIPDEELLELAEAGKLGETDVLKQQVQRMLKDRRSHSLVSNFASQWLHLRNLDSITPDLRLFPDFDDNLRQAMRQETELLFTSVLREDRSVVELLDADYTFLNERLARHYEFPHVYGSLFRRVPLSDESQRGGLLRHGSILTVTSYATRTSPVIRGKWVLENLLGTPPPPPPANVPALKDNTVSSSLSVRERLAKHRANAACASCHNLIDPAGLALENFDALGRWRMKEGTQPIDASGGLPDGSTFTGVAGLEKALLDRPELFVGTLTEKLLAFALGRGIEPFDGPAVRKIVREAKDEDYHFSSIIEGIVTSVPFQMRTSE